MTPSEVIRAAIVVLKEQGWCQGSNAVDHSGAPLHLYEVSAAGDGRARINPRASAFSMYGAIAKVMNEAGSGVPQAGLMWDTLQRLASVPGLSLPESAFSKIHPVVLWNEHLDRTLDEVIELMEKAAAELDKPVTTETQPIEVAAFGNIERKELPTRAEDMVDGRLELPQPVELGLSPEPVQRNVTSTVTDDVTSNVTPPKVIGQVGFPPASPAPIDPSQDGPSKDPRLPKVTPW